MQRSLKHQDFSRLKKKAQEHKEEKKGNPQAFRKREVVMKDEQQDKRLEAEYLQTQKVAL